MVRRSFGLLVLMAAAPHAVMGQTHGDTMTVASLALRKTITGDRTHAWFDAMADSTHSWPGWPPSEADSLAATVGMPVAGKKERLRRRPLLQGGYESLPKGAVIVTISRPVFRETGATVTVRLFSTRPKNRVLATTWTVQLQRAASGLWEVGDVRVLYID